jgi:type IX secretion system PorP/SprF family membrane protein
MRLISIILLFLVGISSHAQQYPIIGQYNYNEMIINPASTGENGALQGLLSWRQQWVGVEGAPSTQNFSIQSPLKKKPHTAIGLLAYSDRIGVSSQNGLFFNYSYQLKINRDSKFRFGIAGGVNFGRSKFSELSVNDELDPNFQENTPLFITPNFSFGVKYYYKKLNVGISLPTLLSSEYASGGYTRIYNDFSSYNVLASIKYEYELNNALSLTPSILFKYHPLIKDQVDLMITLNYNDMHSFGLGYRSYEGLLMHFKVGVTSQLSVGAQYELPLMNLATYKASSFEILILYNALFKTKFSNPRY